MEQVERPSHALELWRDSGALRTLLPALANVSGVTLRTLDCLPIATGKRASQRKMLRLVALFSELAPKEGERTARALRFSNQQVAWIRAVVEHANAVHSEIVAGDSTPPPTVRRWIARAGRTRIASVMRLVSARFAAQRQAGSLVPSPPMINGLYRRVVRAAFRDPVELSDLAVDGDALRGAGVSEGPEMGWVLHRLLDLVLDDPSQNTVENLLRLAGELLQRYRNGER
jgi:hypothetical protein